MVWLIQLALISFNAIPALTNAVKDQWLISIFQYHRE